MYEQLKLKFTFCVAFFTFTGAYSSKSSIHYPSSIYPYFNSLPKLIHVNTTNAQWCKQTLKIDRYVARPDSRVAKYQVNSQSRAKLMMATFTTVIVQQSQSVSMDNYV